MTYPTLYQILVYGALCCWAFVWVRHYLMREKVRKQYVEVKMDWIVSAALSIAKQEQALYPSCAHEQITPVMSPAIPALEITEQIVAGICKSCDKQLSPGPDWRLVSSDLVERWDYERRIREVRRLHHDLGGN
jgi:hypothetical protein